MGYRTFRDSRGTEWQAWDIVPRLAERRGSDRRSREIAVERDRRAHRERRLTVGVRPSMLGHGMESGWLCFEGPMEKRRLTPIPPDWLGCPIPRLEEYLGSAVRATRVVSATQQASAARRPG